MMAGLLRLIIFLLLFAVVLAAFTFASFNSIEVSLWLVRDWPARPLGQWMIAAFSVGAIMGLLLGFGFLARFKQGAKIRQLKKRLSKAEKELEALRSIPLKDL